MTKINLNIKPSTAPRSYQRPKIQISQQIPANSYPISRETIELREIETLSPFATFSRTNHPYDKRAHWEDKDPFRTRFDRDGDRITFCLSFNILEDKAQIFPRLPGINLPLFTTRKTHCHIVAKFGRSLARSLGLNEDLTEGIGLGHDLGHLPFAHAGERAIQEATKNDLARIGKVFRHEEWGLRVVDALEFVEGRNISGLNLTFEVRDGIARHCGEEPVMPLVPSKEYDLNKPALPTTLEGCLIRLVDVVAFGPRDLSDLIYAGLTNVDEVPKLVKNVLGTDIRRMYKILARDIIKNSKGKNMIAMTPECYDALQCLVQFNLKIIRDKLGKKEERLIKKIVKTYDRYKQAGFHPKRILDTFVSFTDEQLYKQLI